MANVVITTSAYVVHMAIDGDKVHTGSEPLITPTGDGVGVVIEAKEFRKIVKTSDTYTIDGTPFVPSSFDQLIEKMFEVFQEANSGSGGSGGGDVDLTDYLKLEVVPTFTDMSGSTQKRLIWVIADEENNGDTSLYLYNGSELRFLLTALPSTLT